jgi:hypothetical protein
LIKKTNAEKLPTMTTHDLPNGPPILCSFSILIHNRSFLVRFFGEKYFSPKKQTKHYLFYFKKYIFKKYNLNRFLNKLLKKDERKYTCKLQHNKFHWVAKSKNLQGRGSQRRTDADVIEERGQEGGATLTQRVMVPCNPLTACYSHMLTRNSQYDIKTGLATLHRFGSPFRFRTVRRLIL